MDIKEVEKLLDCPRANIRFYEKEGLISPGRKANNYRDYSDEDVSELKKILVLRKLGFTVQEIADMKKGDLSLSDAVTENIQRLEQTIEELKGSLELSQQLKKENTAYVSFDEEKYWQRITYAQKQGKKFMDIYKDYLTFELDAFDRMMKWVFFFDFKEGRKRFGLPKGLMLLLIVCIARGFGRMIFHDGSFWEGFLYPFVLFAGASILILPLYILSKKAPNAASTIASVLVILGIGFFAFLAILILVGLFNSVFHF